MDTRTIELSTADGPMPVYEALPDDARGAVIVIQEAFGVNEHIEDVTRRVADAGWHGVAPHIFHRAGGGIVTSRFPQLPPLVDEVATLKTPWLGLFGDLDESIRVDDVERLRADLDTKATVAHGVVRYADAGHGFHCDMRDSFAPAAAKDA